MINFITKIAEYEAETQANINKKQIVIEELQQKVFNTLQEIDQKQAAFNETPSDVLFQKLLKLKAELQTLKINVKSANEIIIIPPTKEVTAEQITKDIDEFIDGLELDKLKNNIEAAKQEFLESINVFDKKVREIKAFKIELSNLNLDNQFILKVLEGHKDKFSCPEELTYNWDDLTKRKAEISQQAAGIYINKI
jgi:hypothetical protein